MAGYGTKRTRRPGPTMSVVWGRPECAGRPARSRWCKSNDEGVANRIDPESCANTREGIGEALTGERIGQPLSRESTLILGADVVPVTEGNTDGRDNASAQTARRGLRHWHVRTLFAREPGDLMVGQRQHACCTGPCREGEEP